MNLRDLEYLVALAEHRHFGRAAQAAYVSQPTLSTQLKKLEAELGVDLIERGARQVLFTAVGERVVRRARRILAEAEEIRSLARRAQSPHTGSVRVGAVPTLAPYLLPHVVPGLRERFPDLEVLLVEEKTADLLDAVRGGGLDAALVALPVADEALVAEPLFREDFLLAAPVAHRLARLPDPLVPDDLGGEDLLLLAEGHCLRDQALAVCGLSGAQERRGFQATSLETLRHMVASGVGVTLMPRLAVTPPVVDNPGMELREFAAPAPHRDIALVWRRTHVHRELLGELAATLRGLVPPVVDRLSPRA